MKDWFENFSRQYFEHDYNYHYNFNHNKKLRPYKDILSVEIKDNMLSGSIRHEKYDFNRIKIKFKAFTDDEKEKLCKIVDDSPVNIHKVINKTLPEELLDSGIKILPESLDELDVECSYDNENDNIIDTLSLLKEFNRRLEKNNFLIFKIRGLDLTRKITYPVKTFPDNLELKFKKTTDEACLIDLYDVNVILLKNVEYPTKSLEFIYSDLFELLKNEINSYPNKFNPHTTYMDYNGDIETSFKSQKAENENFTGKCFFENNIKIRINDEYEFVGFKQVSNEEKLFIFLNELKQADIEDMDEHVLFLKEILDLTYTLVNHNAIMPEIFKTEKSCQIRWIPSFYSGNVINYCEKYYENCPKDLVTFDKKRLSKDNQVIILISLIMKGLIQYTIRKNQVGHFENIGDNIFKLFTGEKLSLKTHSHDSTIQRIQKQISAFCLNELEYSYAMFIDDNLDIEIKIKEDDTLKSISEASTDQLENIRKIYDIFTYFKIENTIYEKIMINNKNFILFSENIIKLLPYVNVELHNPFKIIHGNMDLVLDIDLDKEDFRLDKIIDHYIWKIRLDDVEITLDRFDEITDDMNGLIKIDDVIYIVDGIAFRHLKGYTWLLRHVDKSNEILHYAILEEFHDMKVKLSDNFRKLIKTSGLYEVPQTLKANLRPYQRIGYSWLIQNIKSGFGSILADDMGLGKTVQVLATILYFKEKNPMETTSSLIIVPPTLLSNWQQEIERFTPELSYHIYHGPNRTFPSEKRDIILTSYSIIRQDLEMFLNESWFICVIDEAQNIKNPGSKQTQAIKTLPAFNKIAVTGTPIENRLTDYWSIFDFVNRGYLSTLEDFKTRYVTPIEKIEDEKALNDLKTIAKPFVLRRLKSDNEIRNELPEKFVNDIYCNLTKKQIKLYNNLLNGLFETITNKKGIERKGNILKLITCLKQTCNHPGQYLKSDNVKINESGKMELLTEMLENILDVDEKVLIFTQYVEMGKIIQKLISEKLKTDVLFLHGSQTRKEKNNIINTFQEEEEYKIMVATLKTGGTGLNLTAAQNVIHYDLWWNPAIENQATDRVHRIGQKNDVMVYRFITKGTLEENIDKIIKNKTDLAEKTISTDETFITELSDEELKEILRLRL